MSHLDQLIDKLKEERVRRIIGDILQGRNATANYPADDLDYVEDLGLMVTRPGIRIANRLYQEVIPRELTRSTQTAFTQETAWHLRPDRRLDFPRLLTAFQQFFRQSPEGWFRNDEYQEAAPQLLMQAFLHRVVNGGGRITREYSLGSRRVDPCVQWPPDEHLRFNGPIQTVVIELKMRRRRSLDVILAEGLRQTAEYADRFGADEACLVIFDQRQGRSWDERVWQRTEHAAGRAIGVWGR